MTGAQRAALLLMAIYRRDARTLPEVQRHLVGKRTHQRLRREFQRINQGEIHVEKGELIRILDEFDVQIHEQELISPIAIDFGEDSEWVSGESPFDFLEELDPGTIWGYIQGEHPQTIALILACLPSEKSAAVLQQISPPQARNDVARRIASMDQVMPGALDEVREAIKSKMAFIAGGQEAIGSGPVKLAQILVRMDGEVQESIVEHLRAKDMITADKVVENMLTFNDIAYISDEDMRLQVLPTLQQERDFDEMVAIALKRASDIVKRKFLDNLSRRNRVILEDTMATIGGKSRRDITAAQMRILEKIRQLEQAGSITIVRDYEEEEIIE